MNLAQLHYASTTPGPEGSGPRFTSVTPGVPAALLREAGRLIGYESPDDAPAHPTEEQLAALPVALSLSVLSDGSRLLARAACTGGPGPGTGSGPAGPGEGLPFHAHAVHLPGAAGSGAAQGALPITAWNSPQWASRTPPGGPPPPLAKVPAPGRHDAPGLAAFVAARGARLAGFFADVRRLGKDPEAPRIVLVERDSQDVARWVMLACSVLPHQRGQWLTFTTYTRRPDLAPQQLIGVRPGGEAELAALAGREQRHRILDPAREPVTPADSGASAGPWARTAALVWLAGRPQLFAEVRRLPGDPYDAGPLAALALAAGLPLDPVAHAEAAEWTAEHGDAPTGTRPRGPRRTAEPGQAPPAPAPAPAPPEAPSAGPRHARQARHAGDDVRDDAPRRAAEPERATLPPGAGSGDDGPHGVADRRARMAAALGVGPAAPLPEVARRLALALLGDPERAYGEDVRDGLAELPALRILVLDRLDALSAGDPAAGVRLFEHTGMRLGAAEAVPHLRMCARATEVAWAQADRVVALDTLLGDCGVSLYAEPLVLRTGMRLVWGAEPLPADEARLVLATTGAPVHRDAGTWDLLALAAARAPAGDPAASDLAREVLGHFAAELPERLRRELLLVETAPGSDDARPDARDPARGTARADDRPAARTAAGTRAGSAGRSAPGPDPDPAPRTPARRDAPADGWDIRQDSRDVRPSVRPGADGARSVRQDPERSPALDPEPLSPAPGADAPDGALAATAAGLLAPDRSGAAGLRALVDSEDAELLSAYRHAARDPRVGALLRRSPRFLADCFAVWSSHPQAGPLWQETRTDLLEGVLRPAVRDLPPERLLEAEEELAGLGARRAEEFRAWRRPKPLARLRDRLTGVLRRRPLPPDPGPGPGPERDTTASVPDRPAGADWAGVARRRVIPPPPDEPPRGH
ncbi:GTPase-associated protein 1-related protein [Streptomyces sp. NPDC090054]|uniref:GTPase-associated protein 1-related protein n=1 Tax=Streptomyces sp. NPDC090054 TaxID=3365933 RepID=UPI00380A8613